MDPVQGLRSGSDGLTTLSLISLTVSSFAMEICMLLLFFFLVNSAPWHKVGSDLRMTLALGVETVRMCHLCYFPPDRASYTTFEQGFFPFNFLSHLCRFYQWIYCEFLFCLGIGFVVLHLFNFFYVVS